MGIRKGRMAAFAFIAAAVGFGVVILVSPHVLVRCCLAPAFPGVLWEVDTAARLVALTVDDGPDPAYTPALLELLSRHGIRATFFVPGERARLYPEMVKAICSAGHEIGNHTDTWRNTLRVPIAEFEPDLVRAGVTLDRAPCGTRYFRPAGIWIRPSQLAVVERHGYRPVLGSAYAYDSIAPPASYIAWVIGRALRPGAIIVIHDSGGDRSRTIKAMPAILESARAKNLRLVTLSALIASRTAVKQSRSIVF
jgi:peptidoglycan/xylan/chitin deacetylase (PgdA/CDA1 family)